MYVLGIDGGGTKTIGIIADQNGIIYAKEQVGSTNQNGVDIAHIDKELTTLFSSLKRQNEEVFSQIQTVFAGMSGVDRPEAKAVIASILKELVPSHVKIIIDNDGVNALYSGTLGNPGIVQIAGTGSITFGMNEKGERKRVGGWGYLIDDEGSGYDIGRAALNAVFKAFDGRGQKTVLTEMVKQHFGVSEETELIKYVYEVGKSRGAIAPLSKYVSDAVDLNDPVAKIIINQTSNKLAHSIRSLRDQLFTESRHTTPIVLVGGVFNRSDLFIPIIKESFDKRNENVLLVKPEIAPVCGAVIAALKSANHHIEDSYLVNMRGY